MFSALALFECRQRALLVLRLGVAVVGSLPVGSVLGIHRPPSRIENQFSGGFEFYAVHIAHHCCSGELAVWIEHADEAPGYQVVDVAFHVGESLCRHSGGYYGVVVGHFARVEHLFRLLQRFSPQCREELVVALYAVQYSSAFGIDVVAQILCVHTGVCSQLALIESLYYLQRHVGAHAEFAVAVHLQRGEVVEVWRCFCAAFLLHVGYGERFSLYRGKRLFSLLLGGEFSFRSRERGVAVYRGEHPVRLRFKVVNLLLPVHYQRQRRCLHSSYRQHLPVLPVFQRVQAGGVHSQYPVADGTAQSGEIQRLVVVLRLQVAESLANRLVGHR